MKRSTLLAALAALLVIGPATSAEPTRHDFPRVGQYEVLCGDFHMHTVNSDGKVTTRERVEEYKHLGYDAIAITDHGTMRGCRVATQLGDQLGLIVIRGHESGVRGKEHYVVLGVDDSYKPVDPHQWAEEKDQETVFYQDQMANVARHGGMILWAHPHTGLREPTLWGISQGIIQGVALKNDVVGEGWNTEKSHGTSWYPFAFNWAIEHNIAMMAETDAHYPRGERPAATLLLATERTQQGVLDAIKARRTIAWFDGMLWGREEMLTKLMDAMVQGNLSGGKLSMKNLSPVALTGAIEGADDKKIEMSHYQETSIDASPGPVTVRWENVWIGLEKNLRTTYGAPAPLAN